MSDQHIRGWRKRTTAQAREALQRLIDGCWHATSERKAKACFTIPVNEERDADCIVSDVIIERDRLEREQEEDRAAIRDVALMYLGVMLFTEWKEKHAATIARATGQEGAR